MMRKPTIRQHKEGCWHLKLGRRTYCFLTWHAALTMALNHVRREEVPC